MGDFLSDNPLVLLIGACEVGFWVLLAAGLTARYLLRAHRLSTVLLLLVPSSTSCWCRRRSSTWPAARHPARRTGWPRSTSGAPSRSDTR
jgi:hypothetical protein